MIKNFLEIRRDGKVIPEGMTGVEMVALGWEPDKVLRLHWDWKGQPIELVSPYGFLSRVVRSREYLAVLEDTDATGWRAKLSVYLSDGTLRQNFLNVVALPATARFRRTRRRENSSGSKRKSLQFRPRSESSSKSIATAQRIV